jgi:S1-C subfamily serine protease
VRLSRRFVRVTTLCLVLVNLGGLALAVHVLRQDLAHARSTIAELEQQSATRRDEVARLERRLGQVDEGLEAARRLEAAARARLMEEVEARAKGDAAKFGQELGGLEQRVLALREAAQEHARLLEQARGRADAARRVRELLAPTARVNALQEVGSGTVVWSRSTGDRARSYVLTAWHIVQEDAAGAAAIDVDLWGDGRTQRTERARIVAKDATLDLALLEVDGKEVHPAPARLPSLASLDGLEVFSPVHAVGCPLGYPPMPTSGELTSRDKALDGRRYWMVNAPTIFGNSGGGIYAAGSHELIGVLSRISAYKHMIDVAVPHMGLVTPMADVYAWLDKVGYGFVYRDRLAEPARAEVTTSLPASAPSGPR